MPRPPSQLKAELYPLRHKFNFAFGLNLLTANTNTTMVTLVKNYKSVNNPDTINVNPHHASFKVETGAICAPMSVIDNVKISFNCTLTEDALADGIKSLKLKYMPIFTSFGEKLDSADDETTTTAAAMLELTKDATEEDITPAYGTKLAVPASGSSANHPASTANFTEVFGTMNLTTNVAMEAVPWTQKLFFDALKYYTNKGAIKSMIGKMRSITLTDTFPTKSIFIKKFPPRAVRRIVPYSFFGMLFHCPKDTDSDSIFYSGAITTAKCHVGVKLTCTYDEWNLDHLQEMM